MTGRGNALAETENLGTGLTELTCLAQGLDRAAWLEVGVDLNQGFRPVFLRSILAVYEGTDVIGLDARKAAREFGVLINQFLAKVKNVHAGISP